MMNLGVFPRGEDDGFAELPDLHVAIRRQDRKEVRRLLKIHVDIGPCDGPRWTALHMAGLADDSPDHMKILADVLHRTDDIEARECNRMTAWDIAADGDDLLAMELLLQAGASPNTAH